MATTIDMSTPLSAIAIESSTSTTSTIDSSVGVLDTNIPEAINNVYILPATVHSDKLFGCHLYLHYFEYKSDVYVRVNSAPNYTDYMKVFHTQYVSTSQSDDATADATDNNNIQCFPVSGHLYHMIVDDLQKYMQLFIQNMKQVTKGLWKSISDASVADIEAISKQINTFVDMRINTYAKETTTITLYTMIRDLTELPKVNIIATNTNAYIDVSQCEQNDECEYILTCDNVVYILHVMYQMILYGTVLPGDDEDIFRVHNTYVTTSSAQIQITLRSLNQLISQILIQNGASVASLSTCSGLLFSNTNIGKVNPLFARQTGGIKAANEFDVIYPDTNATADASLNLLPSIESFAGSFAPISSFESLDRATSESFDHYNKMLTTHTMTKVQSIKNQENMWQKMRGDAYNKYISSDASDTTDTNDKTVTPTAMLYYNTITHKSDVAIANDMKTTIAMFTEIVIVAPSIPAQDPNMLSFAKQLFDMAKTNPEMRDIFMEVLNAASSGCSSGSGVKANTFDAAYGSGVPTKIAADCECELCYDGTIKQKSLIQHYIHRQKELASSSGETCDKYQIPSSVLSSEILKYLEAIRQKHSFIINKNNISIHLEECNISKKRTCSGMCFQFHPAVANWTKQLTDEVISMCDKK